MDLTNAHSVFGILAVTHNQYSWLEVLKLAPKIYLRSLSLLLPAQLAVPENVLWNIPV
jgi:hypothetical protein